MRRKKDKRKLPPFVALPWEMLNHKAYKDLPPSAAKALPYFLGKPKIIITDPACYEVDFRLPYGEAKRYGFASATFSGCIKAVMRNGFIDAIDKGGLRSAGKGYNVFRLSTRWQHYGSPQFIQKTWSSALPQTKRTSESDTDRCKKGKEISPVKCSASEDEAVRGK